MVWVVYDYTCDEVNGGRRKFFSNNIHRENYYFTHSKKPKKVIIPPYYHWVVLCTVKDLISFSPFPKLREGSGSARSPITIDIKLQTYFAVEHSKKIWDIFSS
jgi:hypothetical protein